MFAEISVHPVGLTHCTQNNFSKKDAFLFLKSIIKAEDSTIKRVLTLASNLVKKINKIEEHEMINEAKINFAGLHHKNN